VAFFTKDFSASLAPKETDSSISRYVNPSQIGKTLPNPFRCAILSDDPLTGYEIWFDKAEGGKTKRVAAGDYPSDELLAEYEKQIPGTVAYEVDFETKKPTDRKAIKRCVAFFVYDYDAEMTKVLSYTQMSLLRDIERKTSDDDYSDLTAWDLEISKITNPKVTYTADMKPALRKRDKDIAAKIAEAWEADIAAGADIFRLMDGGNPFTSK